jgi:hypothetical protein
MRLRLRENLLAFAIALGACLLLGRIALSQWMWTDYDNEARPAFDALLSGHVQLFLQRAPAYGGSLIIRAPFVLIPKLWNGGELATFRAAAAPCMLAAAALASWLAAQMRARGDSRLVILLVLLLVVFNPIAITALQVGHPEDLFGAALAIGSVLAATRDRPVWSGVLLGLAIANKQWAIVAAGPVLIALPGRRLLALGVCAAMAAAVLAPLAAGSSFTAQSSAAAHAGTFFYPCQFWWFLGTHSAHAFRAGYRVGPAWIVTSAHVLIALAVLPLTGLCAWLRHIGRRRPRNEALLLLCLLLFLRFSLDPWDNGYYCLPFLLALVVWEALTYSRLPVVALLSTTLAYLIVHTAHLTLHAAPDLIAVLFLLVAVPGLAALLAALYLPGGWGAVRYRAASIGQPRAAVA